MARHLTDLERQKIVADYIQCENFSETARRNGVCDNTVRKIVAETSGIEEKLEQKRAENTKTVEKYMADNAERVCSIIDSGLALIQERLAECTPVQAATIMGILIDKHKGTSGTHQVEMSKGMSLSDKLEAIKAAAANYAGDNEGDGDGP